MIVALVAIMNQILTKQSIQQSSIQNQPSSSIAPAASSTSSAPATSTTRTKTYRNTKFGFEFQYPQNWEVKENIYGSPFSKFNLIVAPTQEKYLPDPILFNITTLDFVSRSFSDLENTATKVVVGGIVGKKYEYEFESMQRISIILPFGEYRIILGTEKQYEDIFNQIIASFRFLK